jgi:hypothetical protein
VSRWEKFKGIFEKIPENSSNTYTITYNDNDEEEDVHITRILPAPPLPTQVPNTLKGLTFRTTDPRFPTDGDIILTPIDLLHLLIYQQHLPDQKVWTTISRNLPSRRRKRRNTQRTR